jgi:hypothetical protein
MVLVFLEKGEVKIARVPVRGAGGYWEGSEWGRAW